LARLIPARSEFSDEGGKDSFLGGDARENRPL
jgi:hypothetical protein